MNERETAEETKIAMSALYNGIITYPPSFFQSSSSRIFYPNPRKSSRICPKSLVIETENLESAPQSVINPACRRLILLRHAKSSWENRSLRDHDRPLSKTGRVDAVNVSHRLQQMGWLPELILSSDSTRTRETLQIMQSNGLAFVETEIHFIPSFYSVAAMDGQTAEHLKQIICKYSRDAIHTVMCMGHNRGWEEAASIFSGASIELKTCNAALLEASGTTWEEAFQSAGIGGWKLHSVVKPNTIHRTMVKGSAYSE